jgi:hypothetical protein
MQMKPKFFFLAMAAAIATSGCGKHPDAADGNPSAAVEQGDKTGVDAQAKSVEVPLDGSSTHPETFAVGQEFNGEFPAPNASVLNVTAFEVLIGTYGNSSRGVVKARICQETCSEGTADLSGSKDNDYFLIPLSAPLQLKPGVPVKYTLTREVGANQFAVWSYPAKDSATSLSVPGQEAVARTLKIRLRYE